MAINELKQIIKENFEERFNKDEYKLTLVGENETSKHLHYIVIYGGTVYVEFSASSYGIFEAKSTELLSSPYDVMAWYHFINNVKQSLYYVWEKENA